MSTDTEPVAIPVYGYTQRITGQPGRRAYTFRVDPSFPLVGTILAPGGSALYESHGSAPVIKVPKHGNVYDCWLLSAAEAIDAAKEGQHGLVWKTMSVAGQETR